MPTASPHAFFLGLILPVFLACGGAERPSQADGTGMRNPTTPSPRPAAEAPPPGDDVATGSCDTEEPRDCRVWLPEVSGIKNCFIGTQVCVDEQWSACLGDDDAADLLAD